MRAKNVDEIDQRTGNVLEHYSNRNLRSMCENYEGQTIGISEPRGDY